MARLSQAIQKRGLPRAPVGFPIAVVTGAVLAASCGSVARLEPAQMPPSSSKLTAEASAGACPQSRGDEPIAVCNLAFSGEFEVLNRSDQPVDVLTRVDVETRTGSDSWAVTSALVYLIGACTQGPPETRCMTLAPHAQFRPRPWSGLTCSGQCGPTCVGDHRLRGWPLRFAVTSCNGTQRFVGDSFAPPEFEDVPL